MEGSAEILCSSPPAQGEIVESCQGGKPNFAEFFWIASCFSQKKNAHLCPNYQLRILSGERAATGHRPVEKNLFRFERQTERSRSIAGTSSETC